VLLDKKADQKDEKPNPVKSNKAPGYLALLLFRWFPHSASVALIIIAWLVYPNEVYALRIVAA
jgi:hypothetical protein